MLATMLYGPRDIRFEDRPEPKIEKATDAILRLSATCVCGTDLWPYRGIAKLEKPTPMGHEYCGVVLDGEDLFFRHVHLHGGPAPVRHYIYLNSPISCWPKRSTRVKCSICVCHSIRLRKDIAMDERRAIKTLLSTDGEK